MRRDAFGTYHPAINFAFFVCAIVFGMLVRHPAFHVAAVICSAAYYASIKGSDGLKVVCAMAPLFAALAVLNPLFNPMGDTVLFTYMKGRPYTWESLAFGMSTGAMFVSMMLWFLNYNAIMTSDKFAYLFGSAAPSLSLVFTMVLRLVPNYQRKISQLIAARSCVGKAADIADRKAQLNNATSLLSVLTSWAFENAVTVSDSMRSRGYGLPDRTQFSMYRFEGRDRILLGLMAVLAAVTLFCLVNGAASVEYLPAVVLPTPGILFFVGLAAYAALMALPVFVNVRESLIWRISLSRI